MVVYPELTMSSLGFEVSEARRSLVSTLSSSGFFWREFLLSPTQIGVPNSRLRYYLIARKRDFPSYDDPFEHLPKGEIIRSAKCKADCTKSKGRNIMLLCMEARGAINSMMPFPIAPQSGRP